MKRLFLTGLTTFALCLTPCVTKALPNTTNGALPAQSVPELTKSDLDAWLDGYMPYALAQGDIAGAVVVVVKDGQVLTQRGFGYANLERHQRVDPDTTMFRIGSIS